MPLRIHKFQIQNARTVLDMPERARILSFQAQGTTLVMWAMGNPDAPKTKRYFRVFGTGVDISDHLTIGQFIGTAQMGTGAAQQEWHLFEVEMNE